MIVTQQLGGETALVCASEEGSDAEAVSVANSRREGTDAAEQLPLGYVRCRPSRFLEAAAFMCLRERTAAFLR